MTIVSDILLFREGLAVSLARDGRLKICEIASPAEALPAVSRRRPDAVLVDGAMPNCLEFARRMRSWNPDLPLVGFAISGGAERLVEYAESGLAAFVGSEGTMTDLVDAVSGALTGELACSPRVSALMCERLARLSVGPKRTTNLTPREGEIAALIGRGLSNKEIALNLHIGPSTVKNHVHSILEKLNVRRRSAIVHQLSISQGPTNPSEPAFEY
ncbi:MAG: response regulator transcription factor [Sphingomonas sp.]|uniref:LuxR C-terminal-related transcriptional regulator n=1 Tax=Sphingomonas sp. TaxID=28214 RepID=UPI001AFF672D|nr:response regulator transcription factor [Sphingomonas sp.]MBO9623869.1 response regulator transcription factor [Sphingomonas sp.]